MRKNSVFTIVSVIFSIAIFLVLGEIVIRIEGLIKGGHVWTPDEHLYVQHVPNTNYTIRSYHGEYEARGRVNNWGFIDMEDCDIKKGEDATRIIVMGDSFTEAVQVGADKNFCVLLEDLLNDTGKRYEVLNAGMSDYSTKLEYLYLREILVHFDPDHIILQLFPNDVYDDRRFKDIKEEGFNVRVRKSFLYNHSKFYHYVNRQKTKLLQKIFEENQIEMRPSAVRFFFIRPGNEEYKRKFWRNTEGYLSKIKDIADKRGIGLSIFAIPIEAQISSPGEMSTASQFYFKDKPTDAFDEAVKRFCRSNEVDFIDMLPVFRDNRKLNLYFEKEGHLTETGHELVAKILFEYIKDRLVPRNLP